MQRTAFVTGGSGFIGGALTRRLVGEGWRVRALARSDAAAHTVADRGAEAVRGDLADAGAIADGARGCEVVFHAAAMLGDWGRPEDFDRANVAGTQTVLDAARLAGVRRFVHVGTEAALLDGAPLVDVDETARLRPDSPALYSATKARAEAAVLAASSEGFGTVVLRPRLVWGAGDTTILPELAEAVRSGRFAWIGGGRHLTSTTHVDNVVEGLLLAAERGTGGEAYFVTDGDPIVFRDFVTRLLATQGIEPPTRNVPPRRRPRRRRDRRDALAAAAAARPPAGDAPGGVAVLPGDDHRHLQGARGTRVRPGAHDRRRHAGAGGAGGMRIAVGSDHAGYALKEHVKARLVAGGHDVLDVGTTSPDSVDYPGFAAEAARLVAAGAAERGVLACGSGNGVAIVANKVAGVRAVNAHDAAEAGMARRHNDANVITLSGARLAPESADAIVEAFLLTGFEGGRHARRVGQIGELEHR